MIEQETIKPVHSHLEMSKVIRQPLTLREKEAIKLKYKHTCVYCGCKNKLILTVDHKVPLNRGGTDDNSNLTCSCFICNQLKGSLNDIEFESYMKSLEQMKDLCKIKLMIKDITLTFNEGYYPLVE
mgnify:FL=1